MTRNDENDPTVRSGRFEDMKTDEALTLLRLLDAAEGDAGHDAPLVVYHGGGDGTPHRGFFVSTSRDFASDYGTVRAYELRIKGPIFDSLDPEHARRVLPLHDPYDGAEVGTVEDYMERSSDTWEMLEEDVRTLDRYVAARVTEGGVVNWLINEPSLLTEIPMPDPEGPDGP